MSTTWHRVGDISRFPKNGLVRVTLGGRNVVVARHEDRFYAFTDTCPHQSAPLGCGDYGPTVLPGGPDEFQYGLPGRVIRCPWHKWEWDVSTGRSIGGTTKKRLPTYPVEVRSGSVYIKVRMAPEAARAMNPVDSGEAP